MVWTDWTPRQKKKTKIAGIYLIIFVLIGWGLWSWLGPTPGPPPEQGPEIKPLQILEAGAISLRPGFVDLYARVQNPNTLFGAVNLGYTWKVFNSGGQLILTEAGEDFILPQSSKLLIKQAVALPAEVGQVELELQKPRWVGIKAYVPPRLFITRKNMKVPQDPVQGSFAIEGEVRNASDFDFDKVLVKALLKDAQGGIIAVGRHEIRTLVAGENRFFRISWFDPLKKEPAQAQVVAETNVFLNDNFIKDRGGPLEVFQLP